MIFVLIKSVETASVSINTIVVVLTHKLGISGPLKLASQHNYSYLYTEVLVPKKRLNYPEMGDIALTNMSEYHFMASFINFLFVRGQSIFIFTA